MTQTHTNEQRKDRKLSELFYIIWWIFRTSTSTNLAPTQCSVGCFFFYLFALFSSISVQLKNHKKREMEKSTLSMINGQRGPLATNNSKQGFVA